MDDLTILEIVNLLTISLTSFNIESQVLNDISDPNQFVPSCNLKSHEYTDNKSVDTKPKYDDQPKENKNYDF